MEEQILKILDDNRNDIIYREGTKAVKEITAHVFEFIGWLRENNDCTLFCLKTNTEMYNYWLKEVKHGE